MKNKIIFITCLALSSGSVVKGQTAVADSCYLNEGTAAISTVTYERLEKNSSLSLQNSLFGSSWTYLNARNEWYMGRTSFFID